MEADNIDDAFPSRFLKASDLPRNKDTAGTIEEVWIDEVGKSREKKVIVQFQELDKPLVCNKTNCNTIAKLTGSRKFKDWIGHTIYLYRAETEFQGDPIEAIRIRLKLESGSVEEIAA